MKDKYISVKSSVNGFSFANLGLFRGFGDGIYNAVYSLVILSIFTSAATVSIYVAIYSVVMMIFTLMMTELYRHFSKANIFHVSMLTTSILFFMMGFSVKTGTFVALDYVSGFSVMLVGTLLPLFMSDFSKNIGMEKLSGRYTMWVNLGALVAPMIAMFMATRFGDRSAFLVSGVVYFIGFLIFKYFNVVQTEKTPKKINPRRTARVLFRNVVAYFRTRGLTRAYMISFGYRFLAGMRHLYVPIIIMENGFSKDTLGLVLSIGILPYVLLSEPVGRIAAKYGSKMMLGLGFASIAILAALAIFASGWTLVAIFVLWQIPGVLIETLSDIPFFDAAKSAEVRTKHFGVFRTSTMLPKFIAPLLGVACISVFGTTSSVWVASILVAIASIWILYSERAS